MLYANYDARGEGVENRPKLRVRVNFSYSNVLRFEALSSEWLELIAADIEDLDNIRKYLQNLTKPFGFLMSEVPKRMDAEELEERAAERAGKGDNKYHEQEK